MDNSRNNISKYAPDTDSSAYIFAEKPGSMDFGGLFSHRFSNISLLYSSTSGPTEIHTATRYGKRFILKGLKEEYRTDPLRALAMAKEFEIGMSLEHPNIRRTVGLENVDGLGTVIILEYIDGESLHELLHAGELKASDARYIVAQIADALTYLHSKQVMHRDLKPSNILISHQGGMVKMIDFNLSDTDSFVVLKNPAGTKNYMAPEQQHADSKPTPMADIYSLGVIIDRLAAATGDSKLALMAKQCMNPEPDKRPKAVSLVNLPAQRLSFWQMLSNLLESPLLTWIMLAICIVLTAVVIYSLINRPL